MDAQAPDPFGLVMDLIFGEPESRAKMFRSKNRPVVDCAMRILEEEKPMTLRQLYYRVVSAGYLQNSQREYKRLGTIMTRLREAGEVPRTWMVDHTRRTLKPSSWTRLGDYGDTIRECYRKNFWASLDCCVEIIVEKDAVAGTLQPVTEKYDVALRVLRGYASVSFAGEIADEWANIEKPIFAYYLGDYDPSGWDIERDIRERIARYGADDFTWTRLAIQQCDFDEFDLIPLPVKTSDTRAVKFLEAHGGKCAELDALPPTELRRRVEEAILSHVDIEQWEQLQHIEDVERSSMNAYIDGWASEKNDLDTVSADEA